MYGFDRLARTIENSFFVHDAPLGYQRDKAEAFVILEIIIERYTIKAAPAVSHKEIMKQFESGAGITPDRTNELTKVKCKIEAIGDYEDMEKLRDVLKELAKKPGSSG